MTAPRPKYEAVHSAFWDRWLFKRDGETLVENCTESEARRWTASEEMLDALKFYLDEAISSHPAEFVNVEAAIKFQELAEAAIRRAEPPGGDK